MRQEDEIANNNGSLLSLGPCHFKIINTEVLFKLIYKNFFFSTNQVVYCDKLKQEEGHKVEVSLMHI